MPHVLPVRLAKLVVLTTLVVDAAAVTQAQGPLTTARTIAVSAGASQFDLSGTGVAPMLALRVAFPFARVLVFEGGTILARPAQQFGATTTLVIPELGLQLQVPRPVAPYIGVALGEAFDVRPQQFGGVLENLTVSGALGIRAALAARAGAITELRVRGIGSEFTGGAAEWTIGGLLRF